ncbi:hypothetical protein [Robbsia andropogonis]|uniref:hypothetical protein n=1 Tax=Robbsia andropogonis TaxID=28092 RepID=UPI00158DE0BC|nr:hypothetical protein [Robbsia andropogonis]
MKYRGTTQLAAIWCNDPEFHAWLADLASIEPGDVTKEGAAEVVRKACNVASRSDFDKDDSAAERFMREIRNPFNAWRQARSNPVSPTSNRSFK